MAAWVASISVLCTTVPPGTKPIHAGKNLGELIVARIHAGPVFALARIQENIFEGSFSANISQILEGIHFGANTCRACIRTRANTGKTSWPGGRCPIDSDFQKNPARYRFEIAVIRIAGGYFFSVAISTISSTAGKYSWRIIYVLVSYQGVTLSFFSLMFLFPCCFSCWEFPWSF